VPDDVRHNFSGNGTRWRPPKNAPKDLIRINTVPSVGGMEAGSDKRDGSKKFLRSQWVGLRPMPNSKPLTAN
jgi:hypothetical protein